MKIDVRYTSRERFRNHRTGSWALSFQRLKVARGFRARILGLNVSIEEKEAMLKTIRGLQNP